MHKEINKLLAGYVLGELSELETFRVKEHLADCKQCSSARASLEGLLECTQHMQKLSADAHLCASARSSLFSAIENEEIITHPGPSKIRLISICQTVMNNKIMAIATTAVLIVCVLSGINLFDKPTTTGVAWGELVEKIERIDFYSFKSQSISIDIQGSFVTQQVDRYYISRDGFRIDHHYPWIFYDIITYVSWPDKTIITAFPEIKKYTRTLLTDAYIKRMHFREDPRRAIKAFMSYQYKTLGSKIIDGQEVEGIEINDPKFGKFGFEGCIAQIWVNVATNLPMLFELEGTSGHGTVETKMVFDNFNWDGEYSQVTDSVPVRLLWI